jgi:hypothetical protein
VELGSEVGCPRVGDDDARVRPPSERPAHELDDRYLLRAGHLEDAVHRGSSGDCREDADDVRRCHWLEQSRAQSDLVTDGCRVGDQVEELEELCRTNDRVRLA